MVIDGKWTRTMNLLMQFEVHETIFIPSPVPCISRKWTSPSLAALDSTEEFWGGRGQRRVYCF